MKRQGIHRRDLNLPETDTRGLYQTLAISFYNLGVEQQHLKKMKEAKESYNQALEIAKSCLESETLIAQIQESCQNLEDKIISAKKLAQDRTQKRNNNKVSNFFNSSRVSTEG